MRHIAVLPAENRDEWERFLTSQPSTPFLQSWTMGDVYADLSQPAVRLEIRIDDRLVGICFGHIVNARRGRHLSIPYGPVIEALDQEQTAAVLSRLMDELSRIAREKKCLFIRVSPYWRLDCASNEKTVYEHWVTEKRVGSHRIVPSPLHLLAEYVWMLPLKGKTEEMLLAGMRKTTRNLIRRAQKEGVTVRASKNPSEDLTHFLSLHGETKNRHGFTPYSDAFFIAQVKRFSSENACTLYLAEYKGNVVSSSIHMHYGTETSYHHGASTQRFKVPASYLLQWHAITDALTRGDSTYNFWGIAPMIQEAPEEWKMLNESHPFAGVTLFKTGFGGSMAPLAHCMDVPLSPLYTLTRLLEVARKYRRGF